MSERLMIFLRYSTQGKNTFKISEGFYSKKLQFEHKNIIVLILLCDDYLDDYLSKGTSINLIRRILEIRKNTYYFIIYYYHNFFILNLHYIIMR